MAEQELSQTLLDDISAFVGRATITARAMGLDIVDARVSEGVTHEAPAEGWILNLRAPEATTAERIQLMDILEDSSEIGVTVVVAR